MKQKLPVGEVIGTVGSLVTILSFIGITPEMIGDTAYQISDDEKDAALGSVRGIRASESARAKAEGLANSEKVSA